MGSASRGWRFRRCPACGTVRRAGEFSCDTYGANWRNSGSANRRCPRCYYTAPTFRFQVVRERRAHGE